MQKSSMSHKLSGNLRMKEMRSHSFMTEIKRNHTLGFDEL